LNVACFLNNGWTPNWNNIEEDKYIIVIENEIPVPIKTNNPVSFVYFSSEAIAKEAIAIMGNKQLLQIFMGYEL
jgi:hypothetical protein